MSAINETYSINSLSRDDVKTILESLLFSSSVDVSAEFFKEESLNMLELAKKIRTMFPEIVMDTVYVHPFKDKKGEYTFYDEHTTDLVGFFPEILEEGVTA